MRKANAKLLITFFFIFSILAFSQEKGVGNQTVSKLPAKEKRWALIIGVDTYQKDISPLYGTVNDAKALRDVLIKYGGFVDEQIILMTTDSDDADLIPTRGNIIDQLDKLQRVVPEDGLILFSFSGHGVSIGNDAFIIPADGRIYQNADLMRERAIDVLRIKRAIQAAKVKQVIMFLNACRNDPVRAKGDIDNNLTTAYTKGFSFETKNQNIEAYATLYATSFGDRAYEFLDKKTNKYRGYFSYAIEEGLKGSAANEKGEVTLAGLIRYIEDTVKERVHNNENQRQIPYPTTEGFRNSDLVIAVVSRNPPVTTNPNSLEARENTNETNNKVIRADASFFTFEIKECVLSATVAVCDLLITNKDKDRNFVLYGNYRQGSGIVQDGSGGTRAFDDNNNSYKATGAEIADSRRSQTVRVSLISDIPTKARIYFEGVDTNAKKFKVIQIGYQTSGMNVTYVAQVEVRNVPIIKK